VTERMRASYLGVDRAVTVEVVDRPVPDADQVLVEVEAVGVCGSDVHYYKHGRLGPYVVTDRLILGHEVSGTIVEVGSEVAAGRRGQRVAVEPQRPCRRCLQCRSGRYNLCPSIEFFATPPVDGAFAEYVVIQSDFAYEIPDSVSFGAAALIEPLSVCVWAAQRARITPGSRVLIAGAGPVGVIMAQTARAFGAVDVIVTDVTQSRRDFAADHGATTVLDPAKDPVQGLGVDVFIDASGVAGAVSSGIKAVGPAGRVILVGMGNDDVSLPVSHIQNNEIWVSGVFRYTNTWPLAIELVASGTVDLDSLVTHRFPLDQTESALNAGQQNGSMKTLVCPNQDRQERGHADPPVGRRPTRRARPEAADPPG
jgi:L-iditol 2-dehydrogenase